MFFGQFITTAVLVAIAAGQGNFTNTCNSASLLKSAMGNANSVLQATCQEDPNGDAPPPANLTQISLSLCVGVDYTTSSLLWEP